MKRSVRTRAPAGAALVLVVAMALIQPATARDLQSLREDAQAIADEVTSVERRLHGLRDRLAELDAEIVAASQEIGALDLERSRADRARRAALDRYVERAVEAYKSGPSSRIGMMLSARSIGELFTLAHAAGRAARRDLDSLEGLQLASATAAKAQERADGRKQALLAAQTEARTVEQEMSATIATRRAALAALNSEIRALEKQARRLAALSARPAQAFLELLAPAGPAPGIPDGFVSTGVSFEGIASWYGPGFEGNRTASGDIFDSSLFTAASKELPLGSWLYVEHRGRGVVVLVNDRGPYIEGRVLDLSRAAAHAIGITGLGWVRAEILLKTRRT